ncbi:MAG: TetR/AcrR family transcriptional regulator [Acidimicrobiia bacterium]|nr:TetR/AcrR family transcriptional regulator [Acidimicrobiia bacterium]
MAGDITVATARSDAAVVRGTDELTERILDASVGLVARWGVTKTALADVAKAAGCSRATVYRAFPGGKTHLFHALAVRELASYLDAVLDAIDAGEDLADAVTRGLVVATRLLHDHDAAQFVLEHEPGLLLPFLGFKQVDVLYAHTDAVVGPHFERFLPAERAAWLAEWCARLFLTYLFNPDPEFDLAVVDHARDLVTRFVLPSFPPLSES